MRGWNECGHEETPRFRSVFDCSDAPEYLRHKMRQEELMTYTDDHDRRFHADDGTWLLSIDMVSGELFVPNSLLKWEYACDFRDALVKAVHQYAAKKEMEAACQTN